MSSFTLQRWIVVAAGVAGLMGLTGACGVPAQLYAQDSIPWPRADSLSATVQVRVMAIRGDTVRLSYTLTVGGSSAQPAYLLLLRSDVHPTAVSSPVGWYASSGVIDDSGEVDWSSLAHRADVRPGASEQGFEAEAVGLLDIIAYRVQGRHAAPVVTDSTEGLIQSPPSVWANSVGGRSVGLVPVPLDNSAGALLPRLDSLVARACRLGWISSQGICQSLRTKLERAVAAVGRGNTHAAAGELAACVQELEAQHGPEPGKSVNYSAYWLLKVNAEYVLTRL